MEETKRQNKRLGQVFLKDRNVLQKMLELASITPEEEYILKPKKKGSKKIIVKRGQAQKTKRKTGIKKRRLLIIDSDTEKLTN